MTTDTQTVPVIDLSENCDIHCKSYVQKSMDSAIKSFQANQIEEGKENVTYSEALRRLIVGGLINHYGSVKLIGADE